MLLQQIEQDLKTAMLAKDADKVSVLRQAKNALQYETVALGAQAEGLADEQIVKVLSKEAKKRQEAADLYAQAGDADRQRKELYEKSIIEEYLPSQLSDADVEAVVDAEISAKPEATIKDMGAIIGAVRAKAGAQADGALIARLVKSRLESR